MSRLLWVAAWGLAAVVWDPEVAAWGLVGVVATEPVIAYHCARSDSRRRAKRDGGRSDRDSVERSCGNRKEE